MNNNHLKEYLNVRFPENCGAVMDVTKPPLSLDNTGKTDCSKKLCDILDSFLQLQLDEMEVTKKKLLDDPSPYVDIAVECHKKNGELTYVPFPEEEPIVPVLYFPNGTYLLDDTVSYTLDKLQNYSPRQTLRGYELNRQIMFMGQSREGTILKLRDHAHGFEFGNRRNVISFMQGERSNVAWSNYIENLTIDVGVGNPGAVGLTFFGNNSSSARNLTIRSSDPEGKGAVGFAVTHEICSGCCARNIEIEGFDIGVLFTPTRNYMAVDNLVLKNQNRYGIMVEQSVASFHNVKYTGTMPGLFVTGGLAHVTLADAEFESPEKSIYPAVRLDLGCTYLRNIKTKNFDKSYNMFWGEKVGKSDYIAELSTDGVFNPFDDEDASSPAIEYETYPDQEGLWDIESDWHCVNDFGAVGDTVTDSTDAIQAAMNKGGTVWFQPGRYLVTKTITIPASVKHVHFMNCDFAIPDERREAEDDAIFSVVGDDSNSPLLVEKCNGRHHMMGTIRFLRHDGRRTLHIRDIHTQCNPVYFNTVPGGKVFMEDAVCTTAIGKYAYMPGFSFWGQRAFGHNMNPERSETQILVDGGSLWLLGFKAEGPGVFLRAKRGAHCDILGGTVNMGRNNDFPIARIENSDASITLATNGYGTRQYFPLAVVEERNARFRSTQQSEMPKRFGRFYHIPLYVARGKASYIPAPDAKREQVEKKTKINRPIDEIV